jgi:FkbM family methyltransferase
MRHCFLKHNVAVRGVIHVGAHLGEEYDLYKDVGAQIIAFVEPMPHIFRELRRRLKSREDVLLINKALGSRNETRQIYVGRHSGESTSFLRPTRLYDGFFEDKTQILQIVTLDSIFGSLRDNSLFNMLVTDTQGFDLEVLKGAQRTLQQMHYVYTEVSRGHYHGEPSAADFDIFLSAFGFQRVEMSMYGSWKGQDEWGDLFYMKRQ